jgi:hypothetical protein
MVRAHKHAIGHVEDCIVLNRAAFRSRRVRHGRRAGRQ